MPFLNMTMPPFLDASSIALCIAFVESKFKSFFAPNEFAEKTFFTFGEFRAPVFFVQTGKFLFKDCCFFCAEMEKTALVKTKNAKNVKLRFFILKFIEPKFYIGSLD